MLQGILQTVGGLGLFLLGMVIMTDGLKSLAGRYSRNMLTRFTRSPTSGAVTGAVSTAILNSSSATTVAAVGFVGAGLLTFTQALGIIFGSNIGTTITGWLVALLGFKLKLGTVVLPLIFIGVLMRLFGHRRVAASGLAMAGFGLIFVGIGQLQAGMEGLQGVVTPETFPADTWIGRLQLVAIGIAMTLVTQASSVGVAAAITAVHIGTITFPQAAALVIGMDVGTTITALMATIGGGVESRRTGYSHVVYNLYTAVFALLLLTPFVWLLQNLFPSGLAENAEIALVAFHTSFNVLGVMIILPVTAQFGSLIMRLVPDRPSKELMRLDRMLLKDNASALQAVRLTLNELTDNVFRYTHGLLTQTESPDQDKMVEMASKIAATSAYVDEIHIQPDGSAYWNELLYSMHLIDHLSRLQERCEDDVERINIASSDRSLANYSDMLAKSIDKTIDAMRNEQWEQACQQIADMTACLRVEEPEIRERMIQQVACGQANVPEGVDRLEAIRSLRRISQHMSRIVFYAGKLASAA